MLDGGPGHIERTRIVDADENLQRLAAIDHLETLHDVDLVCVGCSVVVDKCSVVQPDGVDNQFVTFVIEVARFPGQNGGLAKVDSGFDYAANFPSLACVA
jgi:hypothetical protein